MIVRRSGWPSNAWPGSPWVAHSSSLDLGDMMRKWVLDSWAFSVRQFYLKFIHSVNSSHLITPSHFYNQSQLVPVLTAFMTTELLVLTKMVTLPFAGIYLSGICSEDGVLNSFGSHHCNMLLMHKHNLTRPPGGNKNIKWRHIVRWWTENPL